MVTALLTANGLSYNPRRSGYGSVAFFTPGDDGVGGIYWHNNYKDGRYRITKLGEALATTGTVATDAQKKAARETCRLARRKRWAAEAAKRPQSQPQSLHQQYGANAPQVLSGMMLGQAAKTPLPSRFTMDTTDSPRITITDTKTGKAHVCPLFALGEVRAALSAFGEDL